jgi:purine-binding chemotaxis protein CheW
MNSEQVCTFLVDGTAFGVPVAQVQEVIRFQEMTIVPLAPRVVRGMLNLRGQIVMAIDLRRRLGMCKHEASELPINVVVRTGEDVVSFLVDEIGDVIEVSDETLARPPETLSASAKAMILGVHKLQGRLLHMLDTGRACQIDSSERQLPDRS